jgi:hypothetical protein
LQSAELAPAELKGLWADLGSDDAARAHRAHWSLVAAPRQAVPFLQAQLAPAAAADPQHVARLIAALDDDAFLVREKATAQLEALGQTAEPALRNALAGQPSAEARRRIERLLEKPLGKVPPGLHLARAVSVLEHIGTPEARQILLTLAQATPQTDLKDEVQAALQRLHRRATARP